MFRYYCEIDTMFLKKLIETMKMVRWSSIFDVGTHSLVVLIRHVIENVIFEVFIGRLVRLSQSERVLGREFPRVPVLERFFGFGTGSEECEEK